MERVWGGGARLGAGAGEADPQLVAQYNCYTHTVEILVSDNSQLGNLAQYKIQLNKQ